MSEEWRGQITNLLLEPSDYEVEKKMISEKILILQKNYWI